MLHLIEALTDIINKFHANFHFRPVAWEKLKICVLDHCFNISCEMSHNQKKNVGREHRHAPH